MSATTTYPKFYAPAFTLADLEVNQWREVARRGTTKSRDGVYVDHWDWNISNDEKRVLTFDLAPQGTIVTAQHRGPDGKIRLLAMRVPVKLYGVFREDAHMRNSHGELRPRTYNRVQNRPQGPASSRPHPSP
jgi:hypothetical protein